MIVALIDNGSLEPAAHRNLRHVAAALSRRSGVKVHAVSWKHSDRIAPATLDNTPAWTLSPFIRSLHALGQRDFVFVPFFISPQGAIGSALRDELESLQAELVPRSFDFCFTHGLVERGVIPAIMAERVRSAVGLAGLRSPPVILVDHGGPSAKSAALRDQIAAQIHTILGTEINSLTAVSMEGLHPPLLADGLRIPAFAKRDVVVAPLFLSPGRHAGVDGDIARICGTSPARCHVTELVGTHPLATDALADALSHALKSVPDQSFV